MTKSGIQFKKLYSLEIVLLIFETFTNYHKTKILPKINRDIDSRE